MAISEQLIELIESIVDSRLYAFQKGRPLIWGAIVVSASVSPNSFANVYIEGDTTNTISLKNKTSETIVVNDQVYALSPTGNLSDAVIILKK